ncbi:MBL fold metallo-hydrolase [Clostridium botulinum]|uniref:MBL fold metallo-hydrolase n=1 Tax=Clostridium botulinum TaxID=1491 RepID=UPI0005F89989|nr:MBL fold metallo-hydrolase [Clostridium botulinum]KEI81476.1 metal-dependent hydrolase [Clostridium botulinum B2 331]KEI87498.1 metal-dependent hydrolase [Clostridium botulinum B2 267]MBY6800034.1 MBL fold metallo-hydrolase [Clostridium botulinum]MBY6996726.1 MBL fold metallo-hydrolase [Clostridium botulinum]MBY7010434.1 MBL fold metallo-hydrolase [Clostridium botulinum]
MNKLTVLEVRFDFNGDRNVIFPVILSDEKENILIDCGYPNFLPLIKTTAEANGIDISKLTKIIITHHDFDHMGALAEFKRLYPHIKILASIDDEKYISGKEKSLRLQQAESIYDKLPEKEKKSAKEFQDFIRTIENVPVDVCLRDKDSFSFCGGVEIIATPGHMPGHISIYIRDSKTLIAGDALVVEDDKLTIANPQYTLDIISAKNSIKKLLNYEIDKIVCYHGGIYTKDIKKSLENIISD